MTKISYELPAKLVADVGRVRGELDEFVRSQRDARERKSDSWREGGKGLVHADWLSDLESIVAAIEDLPNDCLE